MVQVKPKVANVLRSGHGNIIEKEGRTKPTTECKGEVGTLGSVHLYSSPPGLDAGPVFLKAVKSVGVRITSKDASVVSKGSKMCLRMGNIWNKEK